MRTDTGKLAGQLLKVLCLLVFGTKAFYDTNTGQNILKTGIGLIHLGPLHMENAADILPEF